MSPDHGPTHGPKLMRIPLALLVLASAAQAAEAQPSDPEDAPQSSDPEDPEGDEGDPPKPPDTAAVPDDTATALREALQEERREREAREEAEYEYRQEALSFGERLPLVTAWGSLRVAYRGEMGRRLHGREFFKLVGRADLAEAYSRRRTIGWAFVAGGIVAIASGISALSASSSSPEGEDTNRELGWGLTGIGFVAAIVGTWIVQHPSPVSDAKIYNLAAKYNARLRSKYGLPVSTSETPARRDVLVTPYASDRGGGMVVSGRF